MGFHVVLLSVAGVVGDDDAENPWLAGSWMISDRRGTRVDSVIIRTMVIVAVVGTVKRNVVVAVDLRRDR